MIKNLASSAIVGGILVVIVCFLFLRRFRSSLIVTMSIPLAIISSFIGLYFMGYTFNVISLMSLAIAMGIVVDDAIVVLENVIRHIDGGEDPKTAAITGASEVGLAVAASALSIVAVFIPLLFVKGIAGILFSQLAFVMIIAIFISTIPFFCITCKGCIKPRNTFFTKQCFD